MILVSLVLGADLSSARSLISAVEWNKVIHNDDLNRLRIKGKIGEI